uniref:Uncharacterized protein n=1 Tax=Anguilla anguilla TaxID=7936 RepID=A0A0E9UN76_ANGAN
MWCCFWEEEVDHPKIKTAVSVMMNLSFLCGTVLFLWRLKTFTNTAR